MAEATAQEAPGATSASRAPATSSQAPIAKVTGKRQVQAEDTIKERIPEEDIEAPNYFFPSIHFNGWESLYFENFSE
jgi:hypothetical protein